MGGLFPVKRLPLFKGFLVLCCLHPAILPAATDVKVTGLGIFGNLDMQRRLNFLSGAFEAEEYQMDSRELEDSAFIILQQLKREGYPGPSVEVEIRLADNSRESYTWTLPFKSAADELPHRKGIASVRFKCDPGHLNIYRSVNVEGVTAIDGESVQAYFLPSRVLLTRKVDLAFTEGNLDSRIGRLLGALRNKGYLQAAVTSEETIIDPETGEVDVHLVVEQGPLHRVGQVSVKLMAEETTIREFTESGEAHPILNYDWLRRRRQRLLNEQYGAGFPDARLTLSRELVPDGEDPEAVRVNLDYALQQGEPVTLAGINYEPADLLKASILRRTTEVRAGEPFNLLAVEEGRRNLPSLGMLKDVELKQDDVAPGQRTASYIMTPLPRQTLHLRAGWGSYERARVGLRWEQLNLWQRAHLYELDLQYSLKSANADLTYVVPHFFDQRITAYAKAGHEFREEISFERTTTSFLLGATRRLEKRDLELSVEYSLEIQDADRGTATVFASTDRATVSSLKVRGIIDRRDNILYPTSGYDLTFESKTAAEALGGNANFQKVELSSSYHRYLARALYLHLSVRYGGIFSRQPASQNLPFNERFFLGGENSIRGYQQGQASPIGPSGNLIGAEAYALANVELEQRLFSNLSIVAFWDGLAQSVDQEHIPDNEYLHSVGLGLRLRTPVGPIRLEYGHNLNPRPRDPEGTLHIAVGYPF